MLKRERGSKLMMVTRPERVDVAAGVVARARPARRELSRCLGGAHGARAADRGGRGAQSQARGPRKLEARRAPRQGLDTGSAVEQTADFFRAVGEATHNGVFMLAHEPLVQLLVPSLGAMIDKVPQARGRIATAQKQASSPRSASATSKQAGEWMAKHIRDFRRGFEIARIALEQQASASA